MSFDEFALICTYSVITVLSQAKSGLSFFFDFPDEVVETRCYHKRLCCKFIYYILGHTKTNLPLAITSNLAPQSASICTQSRNA